MRHVACSISIEKCNPRLWAKPSSTKRHDDGLPFKDRARRLNLYLSNGIGLPSVPSEVRTYDFTKSEISARGRLPGLEVIFDGFARRLQSMFATELGKSVDASFDGMELLSYENLISFQLDFLSGESVRRRLKSAGELTIRP